MQHTTHRMQRVLEVLRNPELGLRISIPDFCLVGGFSKSTFYRRLAKGQYRPPSKAADGRLYYSAAYAKEVLADMAPGQPNGQEVRHERRA